MVKLDPLALEILDFVEKQGGPVSVQTIVRKFDQTHDRFEVRRAIRILVTRGKLEHGDSLRLQQKREQKQLATA